MQAARHRPPPSSTARMQSSSSNEWTPLSSDQQVHHRGGLNSSNSGVMPSSTRHAECCMSRVTFYIFLATAVVLAICVPLIIVRTRPSDGSGSQVPWPSVTQISTRDALASGIYDGNRTLKEVRSYGSFGLGTYNGLDGEMIAIDGAFYQVTETGGRLAHDDWFVPFAVVTNAFEGVSGKDGALAVEAGMQYFQNNATSPFTRWVESQLPSVSGHNTMAAIRLDATFTTITTNIGGKQTPPYKPYEECVFATQERRYYHDVAGTVVIFRWPHFFSGINQPGYHLHWLSDDRSIGGHVWNFTLGESSAAGKGNGGIARIRVIPDYRVLIPIHDPTFGSRHFPYRKQDPAVVCG